MGPKKAQFLKVFSSNTLTTKGGRRFWHFLSTDLHEIFGECSQHNEIRARVDFMTIIILLMTTNDR